jgi:DNA (cytosine-5)-methyltransferase 1
MMKHGSLFSGIGGFDLASEWMGWENVFHCEWNEFGKKVLHHYWPNAESFDDITKTDFTKYANKIDILTGGFPCQPYSQAGQRKGKEDERHLWPQMLRAIREIKPKYIVGENVFGLLNWNGGMVFDEVHSDLELEGYEVQAVVIPAAAVNAPHGRDRVWFVAYSIDNRHNPKRNEASEKNGISGKHREEMDAREFDRTIISRDVTNTKFKPEGSDGGTNDETQGNIRRGNEGDVFGTFCGDGITTNPKECGCRGGMCERCADGERKLFSDEQRRSEMGCEIEGCCGIWDVTNTNNNGCYEQWRYDSRRKINARCNAPFKWSANSKDIDNANSSRNFSRKSRIDGGISEQANVKKDKFADTTRVCTMDKKCDECQRTIETNQCEIVNGRTLVQEGHKGFQSPKRGGMGENCQDISSQRTNEQSDARTIINRMEGDVTNTSSGGIQGYGGRGKNREFQTNEFNENNSKRQPRMDWEKFPTQSPICGGDDGLPTELDGITFSKWRNESIKAYGNAIVPQVAYQIFKAIQETI